MKKGWFAGWLCCSRTVSSVLVISASYIRPVCDFRSSETEDPSRSNFVIIWAANWGSCQSLGAQKRGWQRMSRPKYLTYTAIEYYRGKSTAYGRGALTIGPNLHNYTRRNFLYFVLVCIILICIFCIAGVFIDSPIFYSVH